MKLFVLGVGLLVACHGSTTKPTVPVANNPEPAVVTQAEAETTGTLRLEGQVLSEEETPVAGATIVLTPSGRTTTSEGDGFFAFDGLAAGSYKLTASAGGSTGTVEVNLSVTSEPVLVRIGRDDDR